MEYVPLHLLVYVSDSHDGHQQTPIDVRIHRLGHQRANDHDLGRPQKLQALQLLPGAAHALDFVLRPHRLIKYKAMDEIRRLYR